LLHIPIPSQDGYEFPIIQYVDDTIIVLRASQMELLCLKALLKTYGQSTGLRVNYTKSGLVPLNMSQQQAQIIGGVFAYRIREMPFTYLGLPLGTTKPCVEHYAPLMDRVERQLTGISSMLTHDGRLQLVNSVISSLPTFTTCSVMVPIEVLEFVDKAIRSCIGRN
jgi:hypothetical protein